MTYETEKSIAIDPNGVILKRTPVLKYNIYHSEHEDDVNLRLLEEYLISQTATGAIKQQLDEHTGSTEVNEVFDIMPETERCRICHHESRVFLHFCTVILDTFIRI